MNEINWAKAIQVFFFGFGGVFVCLALLTAAVQISGSIIKRLVDRSKP